jgi:hypothetical protein
MRVFVHQAELEVPSVPIDIRLDLAKIAHTKYYRIEVGNTGNEERYLDRRTGGRAVAMYSSVDEVLNRH